MLPSLFDSTTDPLLEQAARFGERRQEVLAGNIANIDTPEYRRRDLPVEAFQAALKEAVSGKSARPGIPAAAALPDELFRAAESDPSTLTFQDGGNRSIEHEVMEMTKNTMMQSFAVEMLAAQLRMLESVASERGV